MTRNEAREHMMQIMYEMDAAKTMNRETAVRLADERLQGNHKKRGEDLICSIIDDLDEIDKRINEMCIRDRLNSAPYSLTSKG